MTWKPLLHFNFANHAALDETGQGYHGRVELPRTDCWRDQPAAGILSAVLFDHPESKIIVAQRPAFAAWRGVRVRAYFKADAAPNRLNLIEGDSAFALFIEPGGILRGTINDGSPSWWGVSSSPGRVQPGRWHLAELLYDSGRLLALALDGALLGVRITAGMPIRPVAEAGIRIGYWPGGDSRYTFWGLMGPVWIDTLDQREGVVGIVNKLLCTGSDGTSRLESWRAALARELSPAERAAVRQFGGTVIDALKRLVAVIIGQASDAAAVLDELTALADELGRLVAANEAAGTDALQDPALYSLLGKFLSAACRDNPAAMAVFQAEALKVLAALPLSPARWDALRALHPELCLTAFKPLEVGLADSAPIEDLIERWCTKRDRAKSDRECPACADRPGRREDVPSAGAARGEVHIHVHCCGERRAP
jgi:hypothetical protein